MGLMSKFAAAGMAKKVLDEARKPKNQRKLKNLVSKLGNLGRKTRR